MGGSAEQQGCHQRREAEGQGRSEGGFLSLHISGAVVLPPGCVLAETRDRLQSHHFLSYVWKKPRGQSCASLYFLTVSTPGGGAAMKEMLQPPALPFASSAISLSGPQLAMNPTPAL